MSTTGGLSGGRLLRHVRHRLEVERRQRPGIGRRARLPDLVDAGGHDRHLAVGAGKDAHIYVVDRDAMGKWNAVVATRSIRTSAGRIGGRCLVHAGVLQRHAVPRRRRATTLKAFKIVNARVSPTAGVGKRRGSFAYPGSTPGISASGSCERHRLGGRELEPGRAARLRRARSVARALQLEPGGRPARDTLRLRKQVHHADGRRTAGSIVGTATGVAVFSRFGPNPPTGLTIRTNARFRFGVVLRRSADRTQRTPRTRGKVRLHVPRILHRV